MNQSDQIIGEMCEKEWPDCEKVIRDDKDDIENVVTFSGRLQIKSAFFCGIDIRYRIRTMHYSSVSPKLLQEHFFDCHPCDII